MDSFLKQIIEKIKQQKVYPTKLYISPAFFRAEDDAIIANLLHFCSAKAYNLELEIDPSLKIGEWRLE